MPSIHVIFKDIKTLTDSEIEELFNNIGEIISSRAMTNSLYNVSLEQWIDYWWWDYPSVNRLQSAKFLLKLHSIWDTDFLMLCVIFKVSVVNKLRSVASVTSKLVWLQTFIDEKEIVKAKQLLINGSTKLTDTNLQQYRTRGHLYV